MPKCEGKPIFVTEVGEEFVRNGQIYWPVTSIKRAYVVVLPEVLARECCRRAIKTLRMDNIVSVKHWG